MYPLPADMPSVNKVIFSNDRNVPPIPARTPENITVNHFILKVLIPASSAASGFSPVALIAVPNLVL